MLVAFLLTLDQSALVLCQWLAFYKHCGMRDVAKITIGCSWVEVNAIKHTFPETTIQWWHFHAVRAWSKNVRESISTDGVGSEKRRAWLAVLSSLKAIVHESDPVHEDLKVAALWTEYAQFTAFLEYFERTWVSNGKVQFWTAAV